MMRTRHNLVRCPAQTRISTDKWLEVREALSVTCDNFANLVSSVDPKAMATADWTVMDTAAHVTAIAWIDTARMAPGDSSLPIEGLRQMVPAVTVDTVRDLNEKILRQYTERAPKIVLAQLRACVDHILTMTAADNPGRISGWLGGSNLPIIGFAAHLTNELLVHGYDISRCLDRPWEMPEQYSSHFFEFFILELIRNGPGRMLDDANPIYPGRIAVEFRSAYTRPATIVLDSGQVSIEEPCPDNDVRIHFKPTAMNLVLFHRLARSRAAMTGSLYIWGRRPWLLIPFLRKVRLP